MRRFRLEPAVEVAALILAVVGYLGWEFVYRGVFQYTTAIYAVSDADEWRYTACSRLVAQGYSLFSQVFSAQPPLLFLSLAAGMRVFGQTIEGARAVEVGFGLLALAATGWLAYSLAGKRAMAISVVLLAVSPPFLLYSHAVEAEGPMMALVTLSLAVVAARAGRLPALLGGLVLAAAILMKLFAVEALIPALWIVLHRRQAMDAVVYVIGAVLPVALDFALIAPAAQWQQVVALHNSAATLNLGGPSGPDILSSYLTFDLGLTILAAAGLALLFLGGNVKDAVLLSLWIGGTLVMLALFKPLFPHHPAILGTSLATAAGTGLAIWSEALQRRSLLVVGVLGILAYVLTLPHLQHDDRHLLVAGTPAVETELAAFVDSNVESGQFVAADDLEVADLARRDVPPPLCDPSNVRLQAGYLTASTLIDATHRYQTAMVVPTFGIYIQVPAYITWVSAHYATLTGPEGNVVFVSASQKGTERAERPAIPVPTG